MPRSTTTMVTNMVTNIAFDENRDIDRRLMAYAGDQLLQAQACLSREGEARHSGIDETRKCIRRALATHTLGARALDQCAKRLDDELCRLGRGLSPLREAQALTEALHRLENSDPPTIRAILHHVGKQARFP